MNWGNRIVVAFVIFIAFILYMVVVAFQQDFDLVAEDYYAQEINFQDKMDQIANLEDLGEKVSVNIGDKSIILTFPKDQEPIGEIHFYHPSREIFDKKLPIAMNSENIQNIERGELVSGNYRVNISWESGGKEYFQQEKIYLQ